VSQLSKDVAIYNISDNGPVVEQARMIAGHDNVQVGLKIFLTVETADDEEAPQLSKDVAIYNISDLCSVVEQATIIADHDNDGAQAVAIYNIGDKKSGGGAVSDDRLMLHNDNGHQGPLT
jgi:hypothetical protein